MNDTILELYQIEKSFGDVRVLNGIDLSVPKGEFITLLGPSGCGKTTTLRIIAGLETPDRGRVFLAGKDVTDLEPNKRNVNTVFQNYALFPHMNVEANIAYSLKLKRIDKQTISKMVKEALDLVQLAGYEKRMPDELSGGQRQRVAIARAIVNEPAVLLLDEPLGALDLQLRHQMQIELKRLQKRLGVTFIYITHDQEEALNMSDRIAVMRDGKFEQIGTPAQVYDHPRTSYVARFVGSANLISGTAYNVGEGLIRLDTEDGPGLVRTRGARIMDGQAITVAVRRESVTLVTGETNDNLGLRAVVKEKNYAGGVLQIIVSLSDGRELVSSRQGIDSPLKAGDHVLVTWLPDQGVIVDLEEAG
ncbi:MAG: ABC transporter ATP-binding protein [Firmicutes bacterium]|jgi:spermidine/putrescine transport system ATP-binding protein|nr:ABC transporter ATP-binding protein [Candidatus Fermentithermobacillaceae bacterium]